jgi:hypothetical protein
MTAALALALTGCAGSQSPPARPAICEAQRSGDGDLDASAWIALVLRGYDPTTHRATTPALDCTGAQVRWDSPALACEDGALARTALPERPLMKEDVIVSPAGPGAQLVWIVTSRFSSGDGLGPVAWVQSDRDRVAVVAVGALRANPTRARLRLETLGEKTVLVAEGDACAGRDPSTCVHSARVVPLEGDRFVAAPLQGEEGQCLSPAWFDLTRREQRRRSGRWERSELSASLLFDGRGLTVDEQFVVHDLGSAPDSGVDRVLHRAQGTRTVRWEKDHLVATGRSPWAEVGSP